MFKTLTILSLGIILTACGDKDEDSAVEVEETTEETEDTSEPVDEPADEESEESEESEEGEGE